MEFTRYHPNAYDGQNSIRNLTIPLNQELTINITGLINRDREAISIKSQAGDVIPATARAVLFCDRRVGPEIELGKAECLRGHMAAAAEAYDTLDLVEVNQETDFQEAPTVSYTHLTLPTKA